MYSNVQTQSSKQTHSNSDLYFNERNMSVFMKMYLQSFRLMFQAVKKHKQRRQVEGYRHTSVSCPWTSVKQQNKNKLSSLKAVRICIISSLPDSCHIFIPLIYIRSAAWGRMIQPQRNTFSRVFGFSSACRTSSLLPAFASWLCGQPEPDEACHFFGAAISLAVVEVVQGLVVPGGRQQTQVGVRGVVCLQLGSAVPFSCYLILAILVHNISVGQWLFVTWSLNGT